MNICIFNPTTTLIDVVDSTTIFPQPSTVFATAQVNLSQGSLVNLSQAQPTSPLLATLADASSGLVANGYATSAGNAGTSVQISMSGVATAPVGSFTVANIGSSVYLSTAGTFSSSPNALLYQNVGTLLAINATQAQLAFYGPNSSFSPNRVLPVTFSTTPVFNGQLSNLFKLTLTGNVTSSTFVNGGMLEVSTYYFRFLQDSAGGHSFAWPTNVRNGGVPNPTPYARSVQAFVLDTDGSLDAIGPMMDS
jgi:hypothetical protein